MKNSQKLLSILCHQNICVCVCVCVCVYVCVCMYKMVQISKEGYKKCEVEIIDKKRCFWVNRKDLEVESNVAN